MNEEIDFRQQMEVRIIALLLGEASPFETAELEQAMQKDPELAAFHAEMRCTIELTREASKQVDAATQPAAAPLKLSPERREVLLARFKEREVVQDSGSETKPGSRRRWLVPASLAAGIIILLSAIFVPNYKRSSKFSPLANLTDAPMLDLNLPVGGNPGKHSTPKEEGSGNVISANLPAIQTEHPISGGLPGPNPFLELKERGERQLTGLTSVGGISAQDRTPPKVYLPLKPTESPPPTVISEPEYVGLLESPRQKVVATYSLTDGKRLSLGYDSIDGVPATSAGPEQQSGSQLGGQAGYVKGIGSIRDVTLLGHELAQSKALHGPGGYGEVDGDGLFKDNAQNRGAGGFGGGLGGGSPDRNSTHAATEPAFVSPQAPTAAKPPLLGDSPISGRLFRSELETPQSTAGEGALRQNRLDISKQNPLSGEFQLKNQAGQEAAFFTDGIAEPNRTNGDERNIKSSSITQLGNLSDTTGDVASAKVPTSANLANDWQDLGVPPDTRSSSRLLGIGPNFGHGGLGGGGGRAWKESQLIRGDTPGVAYRTPGDDVNRPSNQSNLPESLGRETKSKQWMLEVDKGRREVPPEQTIAPPLASYSPELAKNERGDLGQLPAKEIRKSGARPRVESEASQLGPLGEKKTQANAEAGRFYRIKLPETTVQEPAASISIDDKLSRAPSATDNAGLESKIDRSQQLVTANGTGVPTSQPEAPPILDYAVTDLNLKQEKVEQSVKEWQVGATNESEPIVLPIKNAFASEVAEVLNSLTPSGTITTAAGGHPTSGGLSLAPGLRDDGAAGDLGSVGGLGGVPASPLGSPGAQASFQQRLQGIINKAAIGAGTGETALLGQTKVIADQSANALLVFAPKGERAAVSNMIAKVEGALVANSRREALSSKLDEIRLDQFQADGLPLSEVLKRLDAEAKKRDPEKRAINFLANVNIARNLHPAIEPVTGLPAATPEEEAEDRDLMATKINIMPPLKDITLRQALDAVQKVAHRPIKYSVEDYGIVISPKAPSPESKEKVPAPKAPASVAPTPQPEINTRENVFSTFSLNVSDVSFKLAAASLENNTLPDPASIRVEEFVNAFNYHDPAPEAGARMAFAWERARYPFAQNRDILRFAIQTGARGREPQKPLNLVILLDNSGSMERPDRVQIVREALRVLANQLQPQDRISVVAFSRTARLWVDGMRGGKPKDFLDKVLELNPDGGTNLEDALGLGYATAAKHFMANGMNRVILLTDGAANLGNVEPDALKQTVTANRIKGIAMDCFGIGWEGYNDDLLEVLSRNGDGRYGFLDNPEQAAPEFANQLAGALNVQAADVKTQVEFNPRRVLNWRQIGYAKHQLTKEQFRDNTVDAAELAAAESGNALYAIEANAEGSGPLAVVRVRYKIPSTGEYVEQAWTIPYEPKVAALDESSPAMRLAVSAAAFGEWLAHSPYAGEITPGALLPYLNSVCETYSPDSRPQRLVAMLRQAQAITGK